MALELFSIHLSIFRPLLSYPCDEMGVRIVSGNMRYSGSRYNVGDLLQAKQWLIPETKTQSNWDLNSLKCMVLPAGEAIPASLLAVIDWNWTVVLSDSGTLKCK